MFYAPMKGNSFTIMLWVTYPDESPYLWDKSNEDLQEQLQDLEVEFVAE